MELKEPSFHVLLQRPRTSDDYRFLPDRKVSTRWHQVTIRWHQLTTRWHQVTIRWHQVTPDGHLVTTRWPSGEHQVTPGGHLVLTWCHLVTTRCPYPHTFYFTFFCFHLIRGSISTHAPFLLHHLWKHPVQRGKRLQMVEVSPVYQQHRCDWAWNRTIWSWALKEAA